MEKAETNIEREKLPYSDLFMIKAYTNTKKRNIHQIVKEFKAEQ